MKARKWYVKFTRNSLEMVRRWTRRWNGTVIRIDSKVALFHFYSTINMKKKC
jgi:hypothetical protein